MDNPEYQPGASNPAADSEDQWLCFSLAVMSFTLSRAAAPRRNGGVVRTGGRAVESA